MRGLFRQNFSSWVPSWSFNRVRPVAVEMNAKHGDLETVDYLRTALPDVPELARLMRHVFDNYEEARAKGRKAEQRIVSEYGWDRVGEIALERINTVSHRQIRRPEARIPEPKGRRTSDE